MNYFRSRLHAIKHAVSGIVYILRTQPNSWLHAIATVLVLAISFWLEISAIQWLLIILALGLVWICEAFNTAIETAVDLATSKYHPLAKIAKDTGAAAVLFSAITSAIIGFLVLGPPLLLRISTYLTK
jgi:diacylglycerol kinase